MLQDRRTSGAYRWTVRPSLLDTFGPVATWAHSPQPPAMPRPAVDLGVLDGQLPRENAAVVQGCVPLVNLKGDSYRLKDRDLGPRPGRHSAEIA